MEIHEHEWFIEAKVLRCVKEPESTAFIELHRLLFRIYGSKSTIDVRANLLFCYTQAEVYHRSAKLLFLMMV